MGPVCQREKGREYAAWLAIGPRESGGAHCMRWAEVLAELGRCEEGGGGRGAPAGVDGP